MGFGSRTFTATSFREHLGLLHGAAVAVPSLAAVAPFIELLALQSVAIYCARNFDRQSPSVFTWGQDIET